MSEIGKRTTSGAISYPDRPVNMNGVPAPLSPMTYEQFLEWADEDTHAEWVEGEIEVTSPASERHQDLKGFLESTMRSYVAMKKSGVVYSAGFQMKLPGSGREPDIVFLKKANLSRLQPTFIDGPADLVVEIISPESIVRDRETKFLLYETNGVREYWLIDPMTRQAEFYQLDETNHYRQVQPINGVYASRELSGFWLKLDWLWQPELPMAEDAMVEIEGQNYVDFMMNRFRLAGFKTNNDPK